jgi:hypothetical protein
MFHYKSPAICLAIIVITSLGAAQNASAITTTISSTINAQAEIFYDTNYVLNYPASSIVTQSYKDRCGIMEFDLSSIPLSADIMSANLTVYVNLYTYSPGDTPQLNLFGYAGNGAADTSDPHNISNLLGTSETITDFGQYNITLADGQIWMLRQSSDWLGLVAKSADGNQIGFTTPATLTISYVPEPSTLSLLLLTSLTLTRPRRK